MNDRGALRLPLQGRIKWSVEAFYPQVDHLGKISCHSSLSCFGMYENITHMNRCWFCGLAEGDLVSVCKCSGEFEKVHDCCIRTFIQETSLDSCAMCGEAYAVTGQPPLLAVSPSCGLGLLDKCGVKIEGADEIFGTSGHHLYLGSLEAAENSSKLQNAGITHVLDLSRVPYNKGPEELNYLTINIPDRPDADIKQHFDECCAFIHQGLQSGSVLVHCKHGRSRSASAVIAYLISHQRLSCRQAVCYCVQQRSVVRPNSGFLEQLKTYEADLKCIRETSQNLRYQV